MRPGSNSSSGAPTMMMNPHAYGGPAGTPPQHPYSTGHPPQHNNIGVHNNNNNSMMMMNPSPQNTSSGGMVGNAGIPQHVNSPSGMTPNNGGMNCVSGNHGGGPGVSPGFPHQNGVTTVSNIPQSGQQHHQQQCAGCGSRIQDRWLLLAMDRYWHTSCLKCSCCQAQLGDIGTSCFTRAGMILCKNDYIRLFGSSGSCYGCGQPIPASELVMRAQTSVYHLKCFTCCSCHNPLTTGDRYGIVQGSLVCENDFTKVAKGLAPLPGRTPHKVC